MKRIFITFGLILATAVVSFGQTAIVGGTTFDQKEGYDDWGWDFSTVEQLGPAGNTLAANLTHDGRGLGQGFHDEDAGHDGLSGEVAHEEGLVHGDVLDGVNVGLAVGGHDFVN